MKITEEQRKWWHWDDIEIDNFEGYFLVVDVAADGPLGEDLPRPGLVVEVREAYQVDTDVAVANPDSLFSGEDYEALVTFVGEKIDDAAVAWAEQQDERRWDR